MDRTYQLGRAVYVSYLPYMCSN